MNEIQPLSFKPEGFGSVLGNGFALLKRTLPNSGVLTLLLSVPTTILLTYGLSGYMTAFGELMGAATPDSISPEQINRLMGPMMLFYGTIFIQFAVFLILQTVTALFSWEAADGRRMGILEGLGAIFRRPFWMVMVQTFMLGVILTLAVIAFMFLGAGVAVGGTVGDSGGSAGILFFILLVLFGAAVLYFVVATIFRVHTVTIEERGPWHGLIASIALVKGNWWRVFLTVVLVYIVAIALSLPFYALLADDMIDIGNAMKAGGSSDPAVMAEFAANMQQLFSWEFILAQVVQTVVTWLLLSSFLTAIYIDLRARRGDFTETEDASMNNTAWGEPLQP